MRRRHVLVGLAYAGLLAVSCRSATPTPTPAPTAAIGGPTPTVVSPTPTVGPVMTPGRLVLKPPDLRLQSARGEQTATIGPFFWVLESGFAGETTAPGLVPPSAEPLAVQVGETLRFLLVDGAQPPARVTVAVYPQEGNFERIAPDPNAPEGFVVKTEPVVTAEPTLEGEGFRWTVPDLAPGRYFIRVEIEWPQHPKNPRPEKVPRAVYACWVQVG